MTFTSLLDFPQLQDKEVLDDIPFNAFENKVESALADEVSIDFTAGNVDLSGATAESRDILRHSTLRFVTASADRNLTVEARKKWWFCDNRSGHIITVKTPSGGSVAVPDGETNIVRCDGTDCKSFTDGGAVHLAGTETISGPKTFSVQADGTPGLKVAGTFPASPSAACYGERIDITTAGSAAQIQAGILVVLAAGYTGSARTFGLQNANLAAGTGAAVNPSAVTTPTGNMGGNGAALATTNGYNYGWAGHAEGGNVSIGLWGRATIGKAGSSNVGVFGNARNGGGSAPQVGGFFSLITAGTEPTFEDAALIADNAAQTSPIFLARDNGTTKFGVYDGGDVVIGSAALATSATVGFLFISGGAGAPTGTPATYAGRTPIYFDQTNFKIYVYVSGAWKATAALT